MAEIGSQEWIEASLARLEELEGTREALAASDDGDLNEIARLDAEIAELYGQLENVAEDEEEEEEELAAAPVAAAPAPAPEPEPEPEPAFEDNPFGAPAAAAAPAAAVGDAFAASGFADSYADVGDYKPKGGAGKWIVLVLLLGAGAGGFFWWQGQQKAKDAEAAEAAAVPAEEKVIQAVAVPEDTEDLKTAKGQEVDRLPGAEVEQKKRRTGGSGGRSGSYPTTKKNPREDGRSIKLGDNDDPLG